MDENNLFLKKIGERFDRFLSSYTITGCDFLSPEEQSSASGFFRRNASQGAFLYGGYDEAERRMPVFMHPGLHFRFILMDVEEYRLLDGYSSDRKKGSHRYDRIPVELVEDKFLNCPEDFKELVPANLEKTFTTKMFQRATKLSLKKAGAAINVLAYLEVIKKVGKEKNAYLYERNF